ncbi:MAG: RICIN domain-containing protein [Treponema sp.]|uniref:beta-1,3-glucanase family protein n=1 Tax=Treponema sp. TaxID=166 RepID=UPI0025D2DE82|nr:beta-1,3-glucanase family protein [Treponema sp.]MBQ9282944.1 RICIN domain-containing protein [Treponema sp.]
MNRFMKCMALSLMAGAALGMMSCSDIGNSSDENQGVIRTLYSGSNGELSVTGMTNGSLTVSYNAGSQKNFARLFVSEGNGAGLVLANQEMSYSNGVYSYTLSHPTFTGDAKIYVGVLVNDGGVEKIVPQGTLADTTSWSRITYGVETGSGADSGEFSSTSAYTIVAKCSNKGLDVAEWSNTHGTNIHQWGLGDNQANQQWKLENAGDGYYAIVSVHSGFCLDVADWGTGDGVNVLQWDNNKTANQLWKFEKQSSGYYKIVNKHSGKVLDVSAASTDDGANVQQWTWNGSDAQLWKVEKVGSDPTSPVVQPQPDYGLSGALAVTEAQAVSAYSSLAAPKNDGYVSFTFENVTNGKFKNNEIFIVVLYQRNDGIYYWGRPDGTYKAVGANEYCDNYSYTIEDNNGTNGRRVFNIPKNTNGARIFYSYGSKMSIHGPENGVGVVFPSIANPGDPDYNKYYDWLEYTIRNDGVTWVNTTQVDQFGFPALITAYASNGSVRSNGDGLFTQTGVTASREEVYQAYRNYMAQKGVSNDFDCLAETYRIVCPGKSSKFNKNYLDGYINEVWNYWTTHSTTVNHAQGKFILTSDGTNLKFYCTETYNPAMCRVGETYWVYGKPTTEQAFEGSGCLATDTKGNGMEPALQAWVCAALNRHVATRSDNPAWGYTSAPAPASYNDAYYQTGAANYYSGFWHSISTNNGLAYGFCYDDVHEQSSTTVVIDCQKIWVRLGF